MPPPPPSRWTLRTKLLASVLVLFTLVMVATGALTVLETRRQLDGQLTRDLRGALARTIDRAGVDADGDGREGPPRGPIGAPGGGTTLYLALTPTGAVATNASGIAVNAVVNNEGEDDVLDSAQVATLRATAIGATPVRVNVGGDIGHYLLTARPLAGGGQLIVGVSTEPVDELLEKLLAVVAAGTLVGVVLVGVGGTIIIRRSLAPLDRVAATARRVSALKLDSGQVALAERVHAEDADERTEVGQVGLALNTMLDNVESALHARQESEMQVRQFVADASHELRTPLASIRGYAELTRRETEPVPPTVTHAIGRVESEALRMQELVEDLLLLARLDSGRPDASEGEIVAAAKAAHAHDFVIGFPQG